MVEEEDVFDAEDGGCVALLLAACVYELPRGDGVVLTALGTVGADEVVKLPALTRPEVGGAGSAEVGVVGMGSYDQGAFGLVGVV